MSYDDYWYGNSGMFDEEAFVAQSDPLLAKESDARELWPDSIEELSIGCEKEIERISMKDYISPTVKAKLPLRPFEQWVQDVQAGRKSIDED